MCRRIEVRISEMLAPEDDGGPLRGKAATELASKMEGALGAAYAEGHWAALQTMLATLKLEPEPALKELYAKPSRDALVAYVASRRHGGRHLHMLLAAYHGRSHASVDMTFPQWFDFMSSAALNHVNTWVLFADFATLAKDATWELCHKSLPPRIRENVPVSFLERVAHGRTCAPLAALLDQLPIDTVARNAIVAHLVRLADPSDPKRTPMNDLVSVLPEMPTPRTPITDTVPETVVTRLWPMIAEHLHFVRRIATPFSAFALAHPEKMLERL
jgi:hypothetical protein